jgi:hypothetical protein
LGLPKGRGTNSTSKAPNLELGWCFKFCAENYEISVGHTFCSIELKIGVLPILVIQNQKNNKNRIKCQKLDFY